MSVSGLCEICQSATASDRCDRCGAIVCEQHRDDRLGVCVECAAEHSRPDDGGAGPGPGRRSDDPDVHHHQF